MSHFLRYHSWVLVAVVCALALVVQIWRQSGRESGWVRSPLDAVEKSERQRRSGDSLGQSEALECRELFKEWERKRDLTSRENLMRVLRGFSAGDLVSLLETRGSRRPPSKFETKFRSEVAKFLIALDPEAALSLPDLKKDRESIFCRFVARRFEEAEAWVKSQVGDEDFEAFMTILDRARVVRNPARYGPAYLERERNDPDRFLPIGLPMLNPESLDELESVINLPENEEIRHYLIEGLLVTSMSEDFETTMARVERLDLSLDDLEPALIEVGGDQFGSREVMDWLFSFPGDQIEKEFAYHELFNPHEIFAGFAARRPEEARVWVDDFQGSPPIRDALFAAYTEVLGRLRPQEAMDRAGQISDPEIRANAERSVMRSWNRIDRAGAFAWKEAR